MTGKTSGIRPKVGGLLSSANLSAQIAPSWLTKAAAQYTPTGACFWQAALHYVPREPAKDGWVVLRDPEDKGPNLSFQGRDRRPRSRSWLHLDLYTADQQVEVDRLVALAALSRIKWLFVIADDTAKCYPFKVEIHRPRETALTGCSHRRRTNILARMERGKGRH